MAHAKCQYCKKPLNIKEAFKVVEKNQNKYWCNEDCYKLTEATKVEVIRTAKCQICGKKVNIKNAFKVTNKSGANKYYCSEQEWRVEEDRKKKAREDKDRVYYFISDLFGYEIQNTQFFDEWAHWNKLKSNENIYEYLKENKIYLQQICNKSYDNEYQKIRYFSAVLKNSLRDFKPKVEVEEKPRVVVNEIIYEAPTQSLNKRRSLDDLEDMF